MHAYTLGMEWTDPVQQRVGGACIDDVALRANVNVRMCRCAWNENEQEQDNKLLYAKKH